MNQQEVLDTLKEAGAVITNSHIVYTSGKHGTAYINKDAIYPYTMKISQLCRVIAGNFFRNDEDVQVVVGPALGGIVLTQWVADHLTQLTCNTVLAVYAEKDSNGDFIFTRGYDKLIERKRVLVVEDILNTGGSARKVVDLVYRTGGNPVGVGVLCNRGGVTAHDLNVAKLASLVNVSLEAWDAKDCPLCARNEPINTDVGKGREFLAKNQK